ncbi:unnamed protein product [Rodentolepis nana]|uniref:DC_STAMP domain-containing protein n=1 Tax=Rodentolepis nana TaxID=102285 RepID=A0A0R3TQF4_RODNA|nr:unnamed protein product [Rodentolepis nana]
MGYPIAAIVALLLSLAILVNTLINFLVNTNLLPTHRFRIGNVTLFTHRKIISRIRLYSMFEISTISVCCIYWIVRIALQLKSFKSEDRKWKTHSILEKLWVRLLRPITIVTFIASIYTTVVANDDIDILPRDIWNFFTRIFQQLQRRNLTTDGKMQEEMVNYMEAIQLEFQCCGVDGVADWYSVSPFVGYVQDGPYVPFSCIDTGEITGHGLQFQRIIHPIGCASAVGDHMYALAYPLVVNPAKADFWLTLSLLVISFLDRYLERRYARSSPHPPKESKHISNSQLLRAINGTTLLTEPAEPKLEPTTTSKDKTERTYTPDYVLKDGDRHVSETISRVYRRRLDNPGQVKTSKFRRLLRFYAPLIEATLYTDGDSRNEVEGNDYYGGFIATLFRAICCGLLGLLASHIIVLSFLRKFKDAPKEADIAKRNISAGTEAEQLETLEEMMILTSIAVRVCFVIAAIVSKRFRCFLILLGPNLALNAGQSFIAAELTSVAVVGPVRELATNLRSAGSTLKCLMHISSNISSDANSMLKPVTEKKAHGLDDDDDDKGDEDEGTGNGTQSYRKRRVKEISYGNVRHLGDFNNFFMRVIQKASRGIGKGTTKMCVLSNFIVKALVLTTLHLALVFCHCNFTEVLEVDCANILASFNESTPIANMLLRDPYAETNTAGTGNTTNEKITEQENKEIDATNAGVDELFRRHLEKMDVTEKERLKQKTRVFQRDVKKALNNLNVDPNSTSMIQNAVNLGHKIDQNMRDRLLKVCMMMKKGKVEQCNQAAVVACYNIQRDVIATTRLPLFFIGPWCSSQVNKGGACPAAEAVELAKKDCSGIGYSLGLLDGFGAQFAVAQQGLQEFAKSFQLGVKMRKVKETAKKILALRSGSKDALEQLSYMTLDATRGAYAIAFLLATLMKLLFLLLLIKTQGYITKYLTKMDFDNIYVEGVFEDIDERRKKEGRMYLLPLKKSERKVVFWRKIGYTKKEWARSITSLVKSSVLGIGLSFLFIADGYLHEILHVLDIVTQGDIALGGGNKNPDASIGVNIRGGNGFAAALIKGIVEGFLSLSNIDLSYKLSECAPKVVATSSELKTKFALLWTLLFLLGAFSGYLLRLRHIITGFFYPLAHRKRQMHLYNVMLANRARELATNKNLLIQRVKEEQLQKEVQDLSKPKKVPKFLARWKKEKACCVICHDVQNAGPDLYVCPVDGCATCRQCQHQICNDPKFCVACLDRNEESLDKTLLKLEEMYKEKSQKQWNMY